MESLEFTIEKVVSLALEFGGAQPTFRINNSDNCVEIIDSCGGFLKLLFSDRKCLASLHKGCISVQYFKQ